LAVGQSTETGKALAAERADGENGVGGAAVAFGQRDVVDVS